MDRFSIAFLWLALSVLPVFAPPPAGPGEMCGGFVGVLCKEGLRCAVHSKVPMLEYAWRKILHARKQVKCAEVLQPYNAKRVCAAS